MTTHNGDNVRDKIGKQVNKFKTFVSLNKGLFAIAFILVVAIAIWQKDEIKVVMGWDKHFKEKDENFKIIILPFKQLCLDAGKNYDAGYVIKERLNNIINKDSLKVKVYYWENFDFKEFDDQKAEQIRQYHYADMIVYGTYQTASCSAKGSQICLNYLTDKKWNLGKVGTNTEKGESNLQQGGIDELQNGKIQEKVENIAFFLSVLAQVKNINHADYLAKLQELLQLQDIGTNLQAYIHFQLADKLREEGHLETAFKSYQNILAIYVKEDDKPNIAVMYERIGTFYASTGNLEKALEYFKKYNKLEQELSAAYPANGKYKNSLAISYERLGSIQSLLGNLEKALEYFKKFNELEQELYAAYPANVEFKNHLAISYEKLGDLQRALGNLEKALEYFKKALELTQELSAAYPANGKYKNNLAISYEKLGDTQSSLGNLEKALEYFEIETKLFEELSAAYPVSVEYKNNLAVSYSKLGDTQTRLGNLANTLEYFKKYNELEQELSAAYPASVEYKNNLAISYERLGSTQTRLGNLEKALEYFKKYNELEQELSAAYPANVEYKNGLAISYIKLGDFYENTDKQKAKSYYLECKKHYVELVQIAPDYVEFQKNLKWVENRLAGL